MPVEKNRGPVYSVSSDGNLIVTNEMKEDWSEWGYIIVRGLLDTEEITLLRETVEADAGLQKNSYGRDDGEGRQTRLALWDDPADDITGVIARSQKVAGTFQELLGDEVYHYHAKLIMKDARTGGAHIWHQDYGYWYQNGCLFPDDMATIFIAVDDTDEENRCLKIIPKSHKVGRVEHIRVGDQAGADVKRVDYLKEKLGLIQVELKAGDALFFHSNILHRSDQNRSERRRWAYLVAYNTKRNDPVIKHHHPGYTPLDMVSFYDHGYTALVMMPNDAIKKYIPPKQGQAIDRSRKFFEGPSADSSLPSPITA